jgi:hypothetical protein
MKMNCSKILDMACETDDFRTSGSHASGSIPLLNQIQIWLHTLYCPGCARKIERFEDGRTILREDFFPPSPGLEDSIMAMVADEKEHQEMEESYAVPGGISTRGWVISGIIILVSLATAFFGLDFQKLATETGISFLLPVGITVGIVLTTYGALFIGSHLKELSERFGL